MTRFRAGLCRCFAVLRRVGNSGHSGFLLLEALIALTLFAMFVAGVAFALLLSHETVVATGERTRGIFFAERAMEAVRSMRNEDFALLQDGNHGIDIEAGKWAFSGSSLTESGYTTTVLVSTPATDRRSLSVRTAWNFGRGRSGSVLLTSDVTNWRSTLTIGDWSAASELQQATVTGSTALKDMVVSGSAAYLVGESDATPGAGVYVVYDIGQSPPTLGASGTYAGIGVAVAIHGDALYILSDDDTEEVRVYDVSSPLAPVLQATQDLPGSGRGRALYRYGDYLLIGAAQDVTEEELYAYYIPTIDAWSLSGSVQVSDGGGGHTSVNAITTRGSFAYLATDQNTAEIRVAGIDDLTQLTAQTSSGYDVINNGEDGTAIAMIETGALIGTQGSSTIAELILVTATGGTPSPPQWAFDVEASPTAQVNDIAVDPSGRYAFLATEASLDLQIIDLGKLETGAGGERVFSASASGFGQAVDYVLSTDRLYFMTDTTLFIYGPG